MRENDVETIRETSAEAGVRGPDLIELVDRAQVLNPVSLPTGQITIFPVPYGDGARKAHAISASRHRLRKLNAQN